MNKLVSGEYLTFDDVLIKPQFSEIGSRQEVSLSTKIGHTNLSLPVLSANMDTITGPEMCIAMREAGGLGVLHRFWSIEDNVRAYDGVSAVSAGLGDEELKRAVALHEAGAQLLFLDVAHGAMQSVVNQLVLLKRHTSLDVVVGNFASEESIQVFFGRSAQYPAAIKVGVGPGSACTTRIKTGVGVPQFSAILECASASPVPIIADGGMKTPGDIAKAIAAGASAVMIGGMLAGTDETPGEVIQDMTKPFWDGDPPPTPVGPKYKKYRGSASAESYQAQGKESGWRTAEGESFLVECRGPVKNVLQDIEGGLRSACTYVGASNLKLFKANATFIKVSAASRIENGAHGKK